ncbi:MAG: hypothetical protein AAF152_10300 [Cyanobacteria bacterium P01_A01_bin.114]
MNRSDISSPGGHRSRRPAAVATLLAPLLALHATLPAPATVPEQARVDDVLGNSSELLIRRDGRRESLQIGSVLQQIRDALITAPPNNARALLRFLSGSGEDLNFYVQTNPHAQAAIYYFPCQMQGGDYLIGWGLAQDSDRGCENGIQVMRGRTSAAIAPSQQVAAAPKQLAQAPTRQLFYCAAGGGGQLGFATTTSGDPCGEALAQCEASGGDCKTLATGSWWSSEPEMQATLACESAPDLSATGTGETLAAEIQALLPQSPGGDCGLQVYRSQDFMIVPAPDEAVLAQGDDEILVQTRDTDTGLQVDVLKGAINVRTADSAPQLLLQGQRYRYAGSTGEVSSFDREAAIASVDMEVLCTFAARQDGNLSVSTCTEAGLEYQGTVAFCDREQASGGQEGDRRTVQMSTNQGELELEFEMYGVPDRLQILYEGRELLDTGFVSGSQTLSVPLSGKSARVDVIVTGNQEQSGTQWDYTLRCPR